MNETEQKKKNGPSVWLLVALIAALVFGVECIFMMIERTLPEPPKDPYGVMDVTRGAPSAWKLEIVPAPEDSAAARWLEQCGSTGDYHTFMDVYESGDSWEGWIYLPGVDQALTNEQVGIQLLDKGQNTKDMNVYLTVEEGGETAEPRNRLLHFIAPAGETVGQFRVLRNNQPLERGSMCVLSGGQMFWAGGEGGPLDSGT